MSAVRPRLLVVEDEPALANVLVDNLEAEGFGVRWARDGLEGERGWLGSEDGPPDLVVLDVMLPKLDGFTLCERMRERGDETPVLFLSARGQAHDRVRGLQVGADDYLAKPFDSAELAARVAGLIASRRRFKARLEHAGSDPAEVSDSPFMAQVNTVLDVHLSDPQFSIRDWAELLHMDRTTLYRRIKGETGQPPEEYLFEKRLQAAARLLTEGAGNVAEVADAVGFASVSHFSRRFKQRFDSTPTAYVQRDDS